MGLDPKPSAPTSTSTDNLPLSEFRADAPAHIQRLRKSARPTILTRNGRPAAVVMSPAAYRELIHAPGTQRTIDRLKQSDQDAIMGRSRPAAEVFAELKAKYPLPSKRRRSASRK